MSSENIYWTPTHVQSAVDGWGRNWRSSLCLWGTNI
jgi:hypothetical protein